MSCPYLKKIEAYYCEAYAQKVLIPGEPRPGDSCQSKELFRSCSIFKEHKRKINKTLASENLESK